MGIQTFWFQAVCQNHIVWDAVEVTEFRRKHTANVGEALGNIRRLIERLVNRRDERRDAFAKIMANAMKTKLGDQADEVLKILQQRGIRKALGNEALKIAQGADRLINVGKCTSLLSWSIYARHHPLALERFMTALPWTRSHKGTPTCSTLPD